MNRARVLGVLLALILLGCGVVIFLDQRGAFGNTSTSSTVSNSTSSNGTPPATDSPNDDGYGNLR